MASRAIPIPADLNQIWSMQVPVQSTPIDAAKIIWIKQAIPSKEVALFVTHAPDNLIKPHVPLYLSALRSVGIQAIVIVATDKPDQFDPAQIAEYCDQLLIRENSGYDFAAWAHAARMIDLSASRALYFVNDSIVGPTNQTDFNRLIERVRSSEAEFISATTNGDALRHAQSYFLAWKGNGVAAALKYLSTVQSEIHKNHVILKYEFNTLAHASASGLTYECLFNFPDAEHTNPTIYRWRELLTQGFPFIKAETLRRMDEQSLPKEIKSNNVLLQSWRLVMTHYGEATAAPEIVLDLESGKRFNIRHKGAHPLKYRLYRALSTILVPISKTQSVRFQIKSLKHYYKDFAPPLYISPDYPLEKDV